MDIPGFTPKREVKRDGDKYVVTVTPPPFMDLPPQSLELTADQYGRYQLWRSGKALIQSALPDLTPSQREVLMSGIGPEKFDEVFADDED